MHLRKQLRALIAQRVTIVRVSHRCSNAQLESTIYTQTKRTTEAVFHAPLESIVLEGQCMRAVPLANTVHFLINPMKPKRVIYAKVGIFAGVVPPVKDVQRGRTIMLHSRSTYRLVLTVAKANPGIRQTNL